MEQTISLIHRPKTPSATGGGILGGKTSNPRMARGKETPYAASNRLDAETLPHDGL